MKPIVIADKGTLSEADVKKLEDEGYIVISKLSRNESVLIMWPPKDSGKAPDTT